MTATLRKLSSLVLLAAALPLSAAPIYWSDNGHYYDLIEGRYTWSQANSLVQDGWHLATITSEEEQNFVQSAFANYVGEFWLGGYQTDQDDPVAGAADDWYWVTGEVWDYENFRPGEPNEWRGTLENGLGIWNDNRQWNWQWNDEHGSANIKGYIVEKSVVSEPSALALLGLGVAGLMWTRRKRS